VDKSIEMIFSYHKVIIWLEETNRDTTKEKVAEINDKLIKLK
jgi:hypothetical protein